MDFLAEALEGAGKFLQGSGLDGGAVKGGEMQRIVNARDFLTKPFGNPIETDFQGINHRALLGKNPTLLETLLETFLAVLLG
jgi:hypothetical protein